MISSKHMDVLMAGDLDADGKLTQEEFMNRITGNLNPKPKLDPELDPKLDPELDPKHDPKLDPEP